NKIEIEESLRQRYARAVELDQMLENPDGSLPALGDTAYSATMAKYVSNRAGDSYGPVITYRTKRYPAVNAVLPVSKIAVFGQREYPQAHTTVTWTDFIEHGHKLADDLSLQIWAEGESWLTDIGYWPYGDQNRDKAMGWNGSNAPHYLDEERMTDRQTRILGNVVTPSLKFIEISRENTDGYKVTRQVAILSPGIWFVLDEMQHLKMDSHETTWTLAPTAEALRQAYSYPIYRITSKKSTSIMCLGIMGSPGLTATQVHGDEEPFGGWIGSFDRMLKTDAIRVRSLGQQAWQATIWTLGKSAESCVHTNTVRYRTINDWSWNAQINEKDLSLSREHGTIKIGTDYGVNQTHAIRTYDNKLIDQGLDQISEALSRLSKEYPRLCVCYPYRLRASYVSLLCLTFAIVVLVLSNKLHFKTFYVLCGYGQVVAWTSLAYLIHWWYLV
ncbi:MAG: heparinase II/III-family protein, partial [Nitrososphaera sp.]|nr:heparinase II/III-family protein [Nitrososphaera sp.]